MDYSGNCGNISSAVDPYAIDEGLIPAVEGRIILHKAALARTARRLMDGQVYMSRTKAASLKLETSAKKQSDQ
ncbi:PrpF domain-containing protein [Candidatus Formimonas warabiya]|uniref:Uncharacterized protein n=1 Tax=Formimonas warabiya TaxID=1761012 RepID=A0A3G1KY54_FORW1|nr:hypothetical protein DCMF_24005 [Candidatus Formimonas warabiya]